MHMITHIRTEKSSRGFCKTFMRLFIPHYKLYIDRPRKLDSLKALGITIFIYIYVVIIRESHYYTSKYNVN